MDTQPPNNGRSAGPSSAPPLDRDLMVTVPDAANLLGLTSEAVRSRVKRGTLPSRRIAGTVYVLLDGPDPSSDPPIALSTTPPGAPPRDPSTGPSDSQPRNPPTAPSGDRAELEDHVETLKDEVQHLRAEMLRREETHAEEIRRRDHLLAAALERIPRELEAPTGGRDAPDRVSEDEASTETPARDTGEPRRRSWWREFFGIE